MQFSAERKIFLSDLANIIFSKSITLLSCVSQWTQNIISPWCTWTIVEWHSYSINPNRSWPENLIDLLRRVWICGHWSSGPLLSIITSFVRVWNWRNWYWPWLRFMMWERLWADFFISCIVSRTKEVEVSTCGLIRPVSVKTLLPYTTLFLLVKDEITLLGFR